MTNALWSFVLAKFVKMGFKPMIAPAIAREASFGNRLVATGQNEIYKLGNDGI